MPHCLGHVHLVGAGPGDAELLTLKAVRLIEQADALVYDRLVGPEILEMASPEALRVFVGKESGRHSCGQDRINRILVELAHSHRCVVRLKGGDPFVFGRGGEELAFLRAHGVPVSIVPGITAAAGAAAAAGMPLTHRGLATGLRFVTGHASTDSLPDLDWRSLADPDTTLAVYMGLSTLREMCGRLLAHGLAAETPVLAVERATTPTERQVLTTLIEAPECARLAGLKPPTLFVIGRVATLARIATESAALAAEALPQAPAAAASAIAIKMGAAHA